MDSDDEDMDLMNQVVETIDFLAKNVITKEICKTEY